MGLLRLLFWIALIAACFWVWRRFSQKRSAMSEAEVTPMVRCAHCHLHLPRDQALQAGELWFCSQAHWEQYKPKSR